MGFQEEQVKATFLRDCGEVRVNISVHLNAFRFKNLSV